MSSLDDLLITVQPDWAGWQTAQVRFRDLDEVAWLQPPGAPRPLLHAYVPCTEVEGGTLQHECDRGAPHRLLVCVLKSHNTPSVYAALAERADKDSVRTMVDGLPEEPHVRVRSLFRARTWVLTAAALGLFAYGWHRAHATGHG